MKDEDLIEEWFKTVYSVEKDFSGYWLFLPGGLERCLGLSLPDIINSDFSFHVWVEKKMNEYGFHLSKDYKSNTHREAVKKALEKILDYAVIL